MAELSEADKQALEEAKWLILSGFKIPQGPLAEAVKKNAGCSPERERALAQLDQTTPTTIADCLSQADLDAIMPDPNEVVDFCEECRMHQDYERRRLLGDSVGKYYGLQAHLCPNRMYQSGLLHDVVKKIVVQILSKISVG